VTCRPYPRLAAAARPLAGAQACAEILPEAIGLPPWRCGPGERNSLPFLRFASSARITVTAGTLRSRNFEQFGAARCDFLRVVAHPRHVITVA